MSELKEEDISDAADAIEKAIPSYTDASYPWGQYRSKRELIEAYARAALLSLKPEPQQQGPVAWNEFGPGIIVSEEQGKQLMHDARAQAERPAVPNNLAEYIANAIFDCGNEPWSEVKRIAFKAQNEEDMGGLCLSALTRVIGKALAAAPRQDQSQPEYPRVQIPRDDCVFKGGCVFNVTGCPGECKGKKDQSHE